MRIIEIEGPDGAGKTALAGQVTLALRRKGYKVLSVREPGFKFGEESVPEYIRGILKSGVRDLHAQTGLMLAARAEAHRLTLDWIEAHPKGVVVRDRGALSTLAYQGSRINVTQAVQGLDNGLLAPYGLYRVIVLPPKGATKLPDDALERSYDPKLVLASYRLFVKLQMAGLVIDRATDHRTSEELAQSVLEYAFQGKA